MEKNRKIDYCFDCDKDVEYIVKEISGTFRVKDKRIKATIYEAHCSVCGARMIVDEVQHKNEMILFEAYKKESGLITAEELKAIRSRYGLSATAFAKILGLGEKNVTRYENGAVQSESVNRFFEMAKSEGAFWELFHKHSRELTQAEREKSEKAYIAYVESERQIIFDEMAAINPTAYIVDCFKKTAKQKPAFNYGIDNIPYVSLHFLKSRRVYKGGEA